LIREVKAQIDGPLNVNLITILCSRSHIDACIEEGVAVVSFHWGEPSREFVDSLHAGGVKIWQQVGSVDTARAAVDAGIDLIIAQGSEAGGHNFGALPTFVLVPSIVEAVAPTLVLAAGGVTTGGQLAAGLALGADGVMIGTRFVASSEAFAHPVYKQRLIEATSTDTRLSSVYGPNMPHFNPMRVLDTGLAHEFGERQHDVPTEIKSQPIVAFGTIAGGTVPLRRFSGFIPTSDTEGQVEELPFPAGQGVGLIREVLPVAEIVDDLIRGALTATAKLSA
jgi:enoyl-[acyl-carrier protein] reductase II